MPWVSAHRIMARRISRPKKSEINAAGHIRLSHVLSKAPAVDDDLAFWGEETGNCAGIP